ncbi:hypothetical protein [Pseudogemmobacter sonorensis]|uniref:hypothetical protein n=1 Tax=Pseudogemmobacter sonorensis TaxID=2989681 RepID=UPI0036B454A9
MGLFPFIWLAAAAIAVFCIFAGFQQVLLVQWIGTCLYLLSLVRWRRRIREARQADKASEPATALEPAEPVDRADQVVQRHVEDRRFGGAPPDDLQKRLIQKLFWLEQLYGVGGSRLR